MSLDRTVPHRTMTLPVRSLRVAVVSGPDAGTTRDAPHEKLTVGTADGNDLVLSDPTVSRFHVELTRGTDGVHVRDLGSTNRVVVGAVRLDQGVVAPGTVLQLGSTEIRVDDGASVTLDAVQTDNLAGVRGRSASMRRLMARLQKAAGNTTSVLLMGESGTGKERIAHAIHQLSPRANGPFVTVDCASLSPTLVSSELFGHERGAFTGAQQRHKGAFERADHGTLFLDEIGELPQELQPALLGALERRRIRRLGSETEVAFDTRVICATHRDLRAEVNSGRFRLDLFYRIAVVVLEIPALRERADDIPLLVEHFLREAGHAGPISALIPPASLQALTTHPWPGNVRELRNVIEAAVAMGEAPLLDATATPARPEAPHGDAATSPAGILGLPYKDARAQVLAEFERGYLRHIVDRAGGNVSRAARDAQIDRTHLIELLRKHGIR